MTTVSMTAQQQIATDRDIQLLQPERCRGPPGKFTATPPPVSGGVFSNTAS